jgi:hypothetical protein
LSRSRTLARLIDGTLESLPEQRFARQLRRFFDLDAVIRAAPPIHLDDHGSPEFHARQVAHLAFANLLRFLQFAPASGTDQFPVAPVPPDPRLAVRSRK